MNNQDSMAKITHIAIFSLPAFSHQASILEFCKRLLNLHQNLHVTCIFPTIGSPIPATLTLLNSLPSTVKYIHLPPVNEEDLPQNVPLAMQMQHVVSQSMPSLHDTIGTLCATTPPLNALIVDPFANEALEIAKDLNLLSYIYFATSALTLSLLLHLPTLHDEVSGEYRDQIIKIPGFVPIQGHDLPDDFQDRSSLFYESLLQRSKRFPLASGFFVNSFFEIEEETVEALQEYIKGTYKNAPVYLVGPIIQTSPISSELNVSKCLDWLENQRPNSVLYVSFGSISTLSQQQINELALGLELSGKKFLWVFRAPSNAKFQSYGGGSNDDPLQFLPHGFLERTKEQGLVITSWAPQAQILSHTSIGGFLTHCGYNSILESIVAGVPMITWPIFAEQRLNAVWLTESLKVALRPKFRENDGIVEKEEIAKVIKYLILSDEGNEIRQRIGKLKDAATNALKEHGSSTRALSQLLTQVENLVSRQPF